MRWCLCDAGVDMNVIYVSQPGLPWLEQRPGWHPERSAGLNGIHGGGDGFLDLKVPTCWC